MRPPLLVAAAAVLRVDPRGTLPLARQACSDPDGDEFFPRPLAGPEHEQPGHVGPDRVGHVVEDERGGVSNEAVAEITVGDPAGPPGAGAEAGARRTPGRPQIRMPADGSAPRRLEFGR